MKRIALTLVYGIGGLLLLLVAVAFLLPRTVHVERSVTMQATAEQIFPYANDYRAFNDWSPWVDRDPEAVYEFSGPPAGVGSIMSWTGNDAVGTGSQEITRSEFPTRIETALDFGPDGTAIAFFDFVPLDEGTEVTWGFDVDMGNNPVGRYMGLMMDTWVGADYEEGLTNLRDLVENETSVPRDPEGAAMEMPNSEEPLSEMPLSESPKGDDMEEAMIEDEASDAAEAEEKPDPATSPTDK